MGRKEAALRGSSERVGGVPRSSGSAVFIFKATTSESHHLGTFFLAAMDYLPPGSYKKIWGGEGCRTQNRNLQKQGELPGQAVHAWRSQPGNAGAAQGSKRSKERELNVESEELNLGQVTSPL